jgi:hypothetical protein
MELQKDDYAVIEITRHITLFIGDLKACEKFRAKHFDKQFTRVIRRK